MLGERDGRPVGQRVRRRRRSHRRRHGQPARLVRVVPPGIARLLVRPRHVQERRGVRLHVARQWHHRRRRRPRHWCVCRPDDGCACGRVGQRLRRRLGGGTVRPGWTRRIHVRASLHVVRERPRRLLGDRRELGRAQHRRHGGALPRRLREQQSRRDQRRLHPRRPRRRCRATVRALGSDRLQHPAALPRQRQLRRPGRVWRRLEQRLRVPRHGRERRAAHPGRDGRPGHRVRGSSQGDHAGRLPERQPVRRLGGVHVRLQPVEGRLSGRVHAHVQHDPGWVRRGLAGLLRQGHRGGLPRSHLVDRPFIGEPAVPLGGLGARADRALALQRARGS